MSDKGGSGVEHIETDVLIIGGGFGGLFAAIKAKEKGAGDVLIVDKGAVGRSGKSSMAAGATVYFVPEMGDDLYEWTRAVFQGQMGLCNQDMVESYFLQSAERMRDLEDMGVEYSGGLDGEKLLRLPSRGLGPCKMTVLPSYQGLVGGKGLTLALRKAAAGLGVHFMDKVFVNDLVVQDGRAVGAVGCHRRSGDFYVFESRAVIMAAADCGFRGNYACVEATTGDSFAMAYRAGVDLNNMEMLCCNTAPLRYNFEGTGPAGLFGAVFVNDKGEDFLPKYYPEGSGAEVGKIVQAMAQEKKKGNGPPFYLDFTPISRKYPGFNIEEALYMNMGGWMPVNIARLREMGIVPLESKVLWNPAIQTLRGGIMTGIDCMSRVEGLFACGIAQSMGPGLFNGWSSGRSIWSGATAGRSSAEYLQGTGDVKPHPDLVEGLKRRLYNRGVDADAGDISLEELTQALIECIFSYDVSILKSEDSLMQAQRKLAEIGEEMMPRANIPDMHGFIKYKETENLLLTTGLYLQSSLLREETRADHCREDFPDADPRWLKWIVLNQELEDGFRLEELPWERYRFKPGDLEMAEGFTQGGRP